ncbi:MAG: hypothetical protein GY697_23425, partial [Desulfobacterales bacterium]|nr:hypothetical protein [Desulfobacterales bacterium]
MDVGLRNFWEMAGILARSNNRREFDAEMEGIRGEMLSTFDFHNESWGHHHETLIRGLEKKARVLFPDPVDPLQRNLNRGSRGMDNGSVAGSEPEGVIPEQEVAPLYASTPRVPCFDIAPGNEYGGATEESNHSVRSNERFLADYDAESRARALSLSPKDPVPEPLLRKLKVFFPVNLLQMVETYHQWAEIEWEDLEATLLKEWTSAYEEAVSRGIDSQSLKNMVIDRLLEYQSLGITDSIALCYVANSVVDGLEGEYFSSTLTKQVTTNDLSIGIVQEGYQDQFLAPVDDKKEIPIEPD